MQNRSSFVFQPIVRIRHFERALQYSGDLFGEPFVKAVVDVKDGNQKHQRRGNKAECDEGGGQFSFEATARPSAGVLGENLTTFRK